MDHSLRLVLLGGGHAMLPSLTEARRWTEAGVDVTLIDPQRHLYYSGMVPEHLGGVYDAADIRIDLARWAHRAGVSFVPSAATHISPTDRVVTTARGDALPFDVLALDIGGANPGGPAAAIGTKPIHRTRALAERVEAVLASPTKRLRLVVVGGGAAGVEVALNVSGRFQGADRQDDLDLALVEQAPRLLPTFPQGMSAYVSEQLRRRGAAIYPNTSVTAVNEQEGGGSAVETTRTSPLPADAVLWATGTVGPSLFRDSGLPTDDQGFLQVARTLRAPAHPRIFAAGDCASLAGLDLARVGVHAVKQGTTLRTNLDRTLQALADENSLPSTHDLQAFRPYPVTPLILSTGAADGLWTAGPLWAAHPWLLRLKHWIDRRWIRAYAPERWGKTPWHALLRAESAADAAAG